MGRRSGSESVARAIGLFLEQGRWVQADLARALGLTVDATRAVLRSLRDAEVPLTATREGPRVVWELDEGWLAGSVRVTPEQLPAFYALVLSAPRGHGRERLLRQLLASGGWSERAVDAVAPAALADEVEGHLRALLDAWRRRQCLAIKYHSQGSGDLSWRDVSPQLVEHDGSARMVAWCHRSGALRVFRVDRIQATAPRPEVVFREAGRAALAEFLRGGVNGFRNAARVAFWFEFRRSQRWIEDNLPRLVTYEKSARGERTRVEGEVANLNVLARYVASLGGEVLGMDPGLAEAVRAIAQGALDAAQSALNVGAAPRIDRDAPPRIARAGVRRLSME